MTALNDDDVDELVILKGGAVVPETAVLLALRLEARGITLSVTADGRLQGRPKALITADDVVAIKAYYWSLITITTYEPPPL